MQSPPTITTKHWGKVDRVALHNLVHDGSGDIEDLSYAIIDAVQAQYFPHRTVRNFRRNFKDFSGAFDLEEGVRYPQVSILGIRNSHVEPVSLTLAKLAYVQ